MQFTRNLKHIFAIWAITLTLIFGVVRLFGADFLVPITHFFVYRETGIQSKLYTYDFKPSKDIAIIAIDDASLNALQAKSDQKMLTIPKSVYADLIERLESVGVKGIAFDIVFQNKDPDEEKFAETMKKYPNVVIGASSHVCTPSDLPGDIASGDFVCDTQFRHSEAEKKYKLGEKNIEFGKCVKDDGKDVYTCDGFPRSIYQDVSWGSVDKDSADRKIGIWRAVKTPYLSALKEVPTLGAALYTGTISYGASREVLQTYFGPPKTYPEIGLSDFLKLSKLDLITTFAGKYVFIGESGTMIHDQIDSPVTGGKMDGVETHAHTLDGILQKRILFAWGDSDFEYWIVISFLILIFVFIFLFLPKFVSPFIAIGALVLTIFLCRYLYFHAGLVIEIFPVLLAVGIFSFPITFIYRFFIIDREKRMITSAFAHYVDPTLVGEIAEKSGEINLGGESRDLSILFSDIAGFTTISEKLAPMDLFSLMSSYLTRMTGILTSHGGTLDKYIGDAVMGFFGAPLTLADHAKRACATALAMREALPEFNSEITSRGLEAVDFRVGIASGEVMVGNIGSYDRFNYTVLGDTVNLASRLEATSKEYGTHIIVAEPTYLAAKDDYIFRALDKVAVKGKTEGVMIYELIAKNSEMSLPLVGGAGGGIDFSKYTHYEEALALYFEGKYLEAGQLFEKNMADDAPSRVMAMRCVDILKGVVTVEGGVYKMTHK